MHIILLMASHTHFWQGYVLHHHLFVAGMTIQSVMRPFQGILRLLGVIKLPNHPLAGVMALIAGLAKTFLMHVILPVTRNADHLRFLEFTGGMAVIARQKCM
jgi:hypothetical protein